MRNARVLTLLALISGTYLFWNLGGRYLWQDEASCALLAERMMHSGRPLAWDGRNLLTMDEFRAEAPERVALHSRGAEGAIAYFAEKGDFKADTTWIGQPWGAFVLAGVSMALFGRDTVPARAPFVLAGVATVLVLFAFARRRIGDPAVAWVAVLLLVGNVFWFLHVRQCRYYSTATLLLLVTFATYLRWQDGERLGAPLFVASAWLWFHNDFGSPWPVLGVLFVHALTIAGRDWKRPLAVFASLGLLLAPFVVYYELAGRLKPAVHPWSQRLLTTLWSANQYQLPLLFVLPLLAFLWKGRERGPGERRVVGLALAVVLGQYLWMSSIAPYAFYRYIVDCTPLACLLAAFVLVRGAGWIAARTERAALAPALAAAGTAVALLTPWFALPVTHLVPRGAWAYANPGTWSRPELRAIPDQLSNRVIDPNRAAVEFLRPRLRDGDEIFVTYENLPVVFYTGHRVRGGIPAFRVEDPDGAYPRFAVVRRRVRFLHWDVFERAFAKARWKVTALDAPAVPWGNNPDPIGFDWPLHAGDFDRVQIYERR